MLCPKCKEDVRVIYSIGDTEVVVRYRQCKSCRHTFYTQEKIDDSLKNKALFYRLKEEKRRKREEGRRNENIHKRTDHRPS